MSFTMEVKWNIFLYYLMVLAASVASITVSSNGNSPAVKMEGGMITETMKPQESGTMLPIVQAITPKSNYEKSRQLHPNVTTLALNERYRRLIPYMTFYYANDLAVPTSNTKVEVEKAQIIEAEQVEHPVLRQPKKIAYYSQNIPRYQGNRLTQYNIASANPTKVFYKDGVPVHHPTKTTQNTNLYDYVNNNYDAGRFVQRYVAKPFVTPSLPQRKPYINLYKNEESPNIRYYLSEKEPETKYKLVPYEQTPPVVVPQHSDHVHEINKPYHVPASVNKEQIFVKHRLVRPESPYNHNIKQQSPTRKQPVLISGNHYRKQRPQTIVPIVESGFTPIVNIPHNPGAPIYTPDLAAKFEAIHGTKPPAEQIQTTVEAPETEYEQQYYVVDRPVYKQSQTPTITLTSLLKSLQLNRSIPKAITKDNVGSSIRTLLQALNALKATPVPTDIDGPILSTPSPFVTPATVLEINNSPIEPEQATPAPTANIYNEDVEDDTYLDPVHPPSQHLDDFPVHGSTSQQFPLPVVGDEEGGTPGRPGIDYPTLTTIPQTSFNCKTQRYKGFFADTETRCQVWHYCDLNGGQASFLCPNGTIFSQAGLTCDWWFNVRCDSATQLYVLNESLYKFILPHQPKFPEDYSGPLVDKYLTLKFKEMEEQFKKNKNKQSASEKMDADEDENSKEIVTEDTNDKKNDDANEKLTSVNTASVIVESPGTSGNVERLQD